jgi:hypothetical protein
MTAFRWAASAAHALYVMSSSLFIWHFFLDLRHHDSEDMDDNIGSSGQERRAGEWNEMGNEWLMRKVEKDFVVSTLG